MTDVNAETENAAALEAFPRVLQRVQRHWASRECDSYLQSLFMDSREGSRRGFPVDAANDLMFLMKLNKHVRALALAEKLHVSHAEAFRIVDTGDSAVTLTEAWGDPDSVIETSALRESREKPRPLEVSPVSVSSVQTEKSSGWLGWLFIIVVLFLAWYLLSPFLLPDG